MDDNGVLVDVTETYELQKDGDVARGRDDDGNPVEVPIGQHVSMNMWGLAPAFLEELERGFPVFLDGLKEGDIQTEYLLPRIIDRLVRAGRARVTVLETPDKWFGVTYR